MVTFSEFPDEISLCINISNCQNHCKNCHSQYLWKDIGEPLYLETLYALIDKNEGITCIGLMGGDTEPNYVNTLAKAVKDLYNIKVGWYSGKESLSTLIEPENFDYIKLGPYIEEFGPLTSSTTNQKMFKVEHSKGAHRLINITNKFWHNLNGKETSETDN